MKRKSYNFFICFNLVLLLSCFFCNYSIAEQSENRYKAANNINVINYARNLLLTIVDNNFRGSWVIDPENWDKEQQTKKIKQRAFNSLAKVKIGNTQRQVKEILKDPKETKNNGKIWIYGIPNEDGTYKALTEVFFDDKAEHVIGVISFDPKNIVENIGVSIGDPIDKMILVYGEPVDEKDFIEDPDNKGYLGLYYLYPRSGIGFLIGQEKTSKNPSIHGVLVFGKS